VGGDVNRSGSGLYLAPVELDMYEHQTENMTNFLYLPCGIVELTYPQRGMQISPRGSYKSFFTFS
jgi:hypothetical protein